MKKIKGICLFLSVFLLVHGVLLCASATQTENTTAPAETTVPTETVPPNVPVFVDEMGVNDAITYGCKTLDSSMALLGGEKMLKTAAAAFVYELNSDTVVYAYNDDQRVFPSSIVKIMTALLALEQGDLSAEVTVKPLALSSIPEDALVVGLKPGEKLTLHELLHCMMVGSANDAAAVIADHISGSQKAFVKEMNRRAKELGCTDTNFVNPHGLHDDNQYTNARDVCRIVEAAMEQASFMEYFGAVEHTVPATNSSPARELLTANYMRISTKAAYYDSRVTGGRTGVTNAGKRCLVSTVEDKGMNYVVVIMDTVASYNADGASVSYYGTYEETKKLISLLNENKLAYRQIMSGGQIIQQLPVNNGDTHVAVGPDGDVGSVLSTDVTMDQLSVRYLKTDDRLDAPVAMGQKISAMQIWHNDVCLAQCELVAKNPVPVKGGDASGQQGGPVEEDDGSLTKNILICGVCLAAIVAAALLLRKKPKKAKRSEERRRRREQRKGR